MKRLFVLMSVVVATTGCSSDPYPLSGRGASQYGPAAIGEPIRAVVITIAPRDGDQIELLSAEAVGVAAGAKVTFYFSPPVHESDGTTVIGERLEPLAGAIVTGETMGIVAEMTAQQPGDYTLSAIRLHYRLNGGNEEVREGIGTVFTICADDPKPEDCAFASPSSLES